MHEDKTISELNVRLCDIAINSFDLGEKIFDENLVRKIIRSLHKRFDMKVTVIEEAQDFSKIKVYELIGSLLTLRWPLIKKIRKD